MNQQTSKIVRIAAIGTSGRGMGQLREMLSVPGVFVPAVCDKYEDRAQNAADMTAEVTGVRPAAYTDYRELLAKETLDAVLICTTWITHAEIAVAAMRAGCHAAMEVGGAASLEECWQMVRASEETGKFCMLLENCCYDRKEMALFQMVRQGILGEIVHLEGGYRHDLRDEIAYGRENRHGRLANFIHRNGELYPTHQLGPIAKLIGVNRGNRMLTVSAIASKARGLREFLRREQPADYYLANQEFRQGDVTDTTITCAGGETIHLVHDCTLPRPYSRTYVIQGTKGTFQEAPLGDAIYLDGVSKHHEWEPFGPYLEKHEHPLWKAYGKAGIHANGHGGMDYLVLSAFVDSLQAGTPPPIDVYDAAAWMAVTVLSEQSVTLGGAPVPVPDFTNGKWIDRDPFRRSVYCLEAVCEDCFL
ncbi:MAG: Gfo/Idh/MocA family oxidoreductase [Oscillospiraceae bacterium]|jgi:predicted dehydrogenase|nr:Gfo/Idh/MocA family oxidoreductase [Oscillospiraceae bacterium]